MTLEITSDKTALVNALNSLLYVGNTGLGTFDITSTNWVSNPDGSVSEPTDTINFRPNAEVVAAVQAWVSDPNPHQPPATPSPSSGSPTLTGQALTMVGGQRDIHVGDTLA